MKVNNPAYADMGEIIAKLDAMAGQVNNLTSSISGLGAVRTSSLAENLHTIATFPNTTGRTFSGGWLIPKNGAYVFYLDWTTANAGAELIFYRESAFGSKTFAMSVNSAPLLSDIAPGTVSSNVLFGSYENINVGSSSGTYKSTVVGYFFKGETIGAGFPTATNVILKVGYVEV